METARRLRPTQTALRGNRSGSADPQRKVWCAENDLSLAHLPPYLQHVRFPHRRRCLGLRACHHSSHKRNPHRKNLYSRDSRRTQTEILGSRFAKKSRRPGRRTEQARALGHLRLQRRTPRDLEQQPPRLHRRHRRPPPQNRPEITWHEFSRDPSPPSARKTPCPRAR